LLQMTSGIFLIISMHLDACAHKDTLSREIKKNTGQLSKVAAAIMAETDFTQVYSIKGGMRGWNRWMKLSRNILIHKIPSCCTQIP